MKRLNNKGVTLIELIVSFAIVSVAMVYFYQTLYTVRKLYVIAQTETQAFVDRDYAIRIVDKFIDEWGFDYLDGRIGSKYICNKYNLKYKGKNCKSISYDNVNKVTINWEGESPLSFYKSKIDKNVKTESGEIVEKTNDAIEDCIERNKSVLSASFFSDSPIAKNDVEYISFSETTTMNNPIGAWDASDASQENRGPVIAWYTDNDKNGLYELTISGDGKVYFPKSCNMLFSGFNNLKNINFENINTSDVENMSYMFYKSKIKNQLKLDFFDTSNVINMRSMFEEYETEAESLEFNFDATNLEYVFKMFYKSRIKKLSLNNFKTKKVKDFSNGNASGYHGMFENSTVEYLDLSGIDLSNAQYSMKMFYFCSNLKTLILDNGIFNSSVVQHNFDQFLVGTPDFIDIYMRNISGGNGYYKDRSASTYYGKYIHTNNSDFKKSRLGSSVFKNCTFIIE